MKVKVTKSTGFWEVITITNNKGYVFNATIEPKFNGQKIDKWEGRCSCEFHDVMILKPTETKEQIIKNIKEMAKEFFKVKKYFSSITNVYESSAVIDKWSLPEEKQIGK